jgi:hypothetical protein
MPKPVTAAAAPARPRLVPPAEAVQRSGWALDLRLLWNVSESAGVVWGAAWTDDGDDFLDLPSIELAGEDVQGDVIELLRSLWTDSLAIRRAELELAEDDPA